MIIDKNRTIFEKIENKEDHVKKDVDADCIVEEEINENLSNNLNKFDVKEYEKLLDLDTDLEEIETEDGEVKNVVAIYENANDGDQCLLGVECDDGTFGVLVYGYETNHFASVDSQEAMEDAVLNKDYKEFFPDATDIEADSFDDYSDDEDVDVEPEQQILSDEDDVDDEFDATDDIIDYIENGYFDDEEEDMDSIKEDLEKEPLEEANFITRGIYSIDDLTTGWEVTAYNGTKTSNMTPDKKYTSSFSKLSQAKKYAKELADTHFAVAIDSKGESQYCRDIEFDRHNASKLIGFDPEHIVFYVDGNLKLDLTDKLTDMYRDAKKSGNKEAKTLKYADKHGSR